MSAEYEWAYLSNILAKSYGQDLLENYVYSDGDFVDRNDRAVALMTVESFNSRLTIQASLIHRRK